MAITFWTALIAIPLLLACSAFLSGSETALTGASRARLHQMSSEGSDRAARVLRLLEHPDQPLGAILIGNNLVNILAASLATYVLVELYGDGGVILATLGMTALIVVLAEIAPKTYAMAAPSETALRAASPIRALVLLLLPVLRLTRLMTAGVLRLFGAKPDASGSVFAAREEIRGAIDLGHLSGAFLREHRDMLVAALDIENAEVTEVMTSRGDVDMLDADADPEYLLDTCLNSSHSRLPIWRGSRDSIVGIVHARDLFRTMHSHRCDNGGLERFDIMEIANEPWFIPESRSLAEQLKAFQAQKLTMALVVDEFGDFQGVVTLEDILEDIVGDIVDEHDEETPGVSPTDDGAFEVDGSVTIRDLNRIQRWRLPDEDATTVAGLVIHEAGTIPSVGQEFDFHGFRFQVQKRERNRVTRLLIRPLRTLSSEKDRKGAPRLSSRDENIPEGVAKTLRLPH